MHGLSGSCSSVLFPWDSPIETTFRRFAANAPPQSPSAPAPPQGGAKCFLLPPVGEVPRSGDGGAFCGVADIPLLRGECTPSAAFGASSPGGGAKFPLWGKSRAAGIGVYSYGAAAGPQFSSLNSQIFSFPMHIEALPVYFFSYSFMSTYPLALRFPVSSFSRYTPWSSGAKPGRMFAVSTKSRK